MELVAAGHRESVGIMLQYARPKCEEEYFPAKVAIIEWIKEINVR
jgi:hypothetical protein